MEKTMPESLFTDHSNTIDNIKALIEIPAYSSPVKYEVDKVTGEILVDRFLEVAMQYPCNYGHIPGTIGGDGDELDVLVITPYPLQTGVYIQCRPVGLLNMTDEGGEDTKIIAVPVPKLTRHYNRVQCIEDLQHVHPTLLGALRHFFEHYKDLDEGKWVKVNEGWGSVEDAKAVIAAGIDAYKKHKEIG
jgi:inorganic pyrophosphatase